MASQAISSHIKYHLLGVRSHAQQICVAGFVVDFRHGFGDRPSRKPCVATGAARAADTLSEAGSGSAGL